MMTKMMMTLSCTVTWENTDIGDTLQYTKSMIRQVDYNHAIWVMQGLQRETLKQGSRCQIGADMADL